MRVAVVGSGVSGLAAASTLAKHGVHVILFESGDYVGGHSCTKQVPSYNADGSSVAVDCGFMVFNNVTYPNMLQWFHEHDVLLEPSDMSLGVSAKDGWLEWGSEGLDSVFAQRSNLLNPFFLAMIRDLRRFETDVLKYLDSIVVNESSDYLMRMTLGEFLSKMEYSHYFINYYILPVCGAIWSCPTNSALDFPAYFILKFMKNHHLLQIFDRPRWSTVAGRSQNGYVQKVIAPFKDNVHLNTAIESVKILDSGKLLLTDSKGQEYVVDRIIMATHAPDSLRICGDALSPEQATYLAKFEYVDNDIWLHSDPNLMPKNKSVWSSWNFLGNNEDKVSVSYWLNKLQNIPMSSEDCPIIVTLNPPADKFPSKYYERFSMAHPVPTVESAIAQQQTDSIQGINGLYFAGAYQGYGFHEDGVKAGMSAAHHVLNNRWKPIPSLQSRLITNLYDRGSQKLVLDFFSKFIRVGRLQVVEEGGDIYVFGNGGGEVSNIVVTSPKFYTSILTRYDLGVADCYVDGIMKTNDLLSFFKLLIANRDSTRRENNGRVGYLFTSLFSLSLSYIDHNLMKRNSTSQTIKNISAHYDLGNEFFKLILDPSMSYSCGIYRNPTDSLYDAQMNKIENLISKARIRSTDRVLEIGFGWGALSIYMAKRIGCHVTGITLSAEQKLYAEELITKEGLQDLIHYELVDYRKFQPSEAFDRIVSCEMLEAVGHEFLGEYFSQCQKLMKPDGILVVQVITVPDYAYDEYRTGVDFIQEYIFPGGFCPCLSALTDAMKNNSELMIEELENIGPHYAPTLAAWYDNLKTHEEKLPSLGLGMDDRFVRIWEYYFKYCEAGFATRSLSDLQLVISRPNNSNLNIPVGIGNTMMEYAPSA